MPETKRLAISLVVIIAAFSIVFAVAASLNVTAGTLGAGTSEVSSCDSDGVGTTYEASFSPTAGAYEVKKVSVTGIATPACDGRTLKVTLLDASDEVLAERTVTLATPAADPTELDFSADDVLATDVHKVAVVLFG
jgi:hypothetical protein